MPNEDANSADRHTAMNSKCWDIIVVTTGNQSWRAALQEECSTLSAGGYLPPHHELIVVNDPVGAHEPTETSRSGYLAGVGSGGATINAILVAAESLSALKGRSMINGDDLKSSRVLLVHVGRPSQQHWLLHPSVEGLIFSGSSTSDTSSSTSRNNDETSGSSSGSKYSSGSVGTNTPTSGSNTDKLSRAVDVSLRERLPWPATPLLTALWNATRLAECFAEGVWVSSVECGLVFPSDEAVSHVPMASALQAVSDVLLCTVSVPVAEALNHGLVLTDEQGVVEQIIYRPTRQQCERASVDGHVPIISGQLYLSSVVCEKLLSLHHLPPFSHCTYHATDSGLQPFSISLYLELVAALCSGNTREQFVAGSPPAAPSTAPVLNSDRCTDGTSTTSSSSSQPDESSCHELQHHNRQLRSLAREKAWELLSKHTLVAFMLPSVGFHYTSAQRPLVDDPLYQQIQQSHGDMHVVNSIIIGSLVTSVTSFKLKGKPTFLSDVVVGKNCSLRVGGGSVLLGLALPDSTTSVEFDLGGGLVWQQCSLDDDCSSQQSLVVTCHGITDSMQLEHPKGGMFNRSWDEVLRWMGSTPEQIWPNGLPRTPLNAHLFTSGLTVQEQISRLLGLRSNLFRNSTGLSLASAASSGQQRELTYYSIASIGQLCSPLHFQQQRRELLQEYILSQVSQPCHSKCVDVKKPLSYLSSADRTALVHVFGRLHDLADATAEGAELSSSSSSWCWSSGVASTRLLAVAADVLSALAGWRGNIRTGPAANKLFDAAFQQLQSGSLRAGLSSLYCAYSQLSRGVSYSNCGSSAGAGGKEGDASSAATFTRAARHYQRAVHLLIARQVLESVRPVSAILLSPPAGGAVPPEGVWVEGRCPARLDLAGGWTDTPPVCYELGGAVLNVAITVNGEKPIIVRGRWNGRQDCSGPCQAAAEGPGHCSRQHSGVTCLLRSAGARVTNTRLTTATDTDRPGKCDNAGDTSGQKGLSCNPKDAVSEESPSSGSSTGEQVLQLHWTRCDQFKDYHNPLSPGALVKAALVYCGIVDLHSQEDLDQQLSRYGGWLELEIISRLPPGSGLGGSSLVAGALLAVLAVLTGHGSVSTTALIHATLALEQCMTTGGGWQDQVGGLYGGVKLGVSYGKLPVKVESYCVPLSSRMLRLTNERLLLIYTGQVRLAKNLLQSVVRSWYSGDAALHATFRQLIECALSAAAAVVHQDLDSVARCVSHYWTLKKTVAPGSEPLRVTELLASLEPYIIGASLAGAGGGGYLYALMNAATSAASPARGAVTAAAAAGGGGRGDDLPADLLGEGVVRDRVQVATTGLTVTRAGQVVLQVEQPRHQLDDELLAEMSSGLLAN